MDLLWENYGQSGFVGNLSNFKKKIKELTFECILNIFSNFLL